MAKRKKRRGPGLLREFLKENDMSVSAFASAVKRSRQAVYGWLDDRKAPLLRSVLDIERVTNSRVPAESWE